MRMNLKRFAICLGIQSAMAVVAMFVKGIADAQTTKDILMCLSDGFFFGGALMLVGAGLAWSSGQGVADGISYSVGRFFKRRGPGYEENRREGYAAYKERKHAKKPHVLEMTIAGLLYVIVSIVLMIPYSNL